MWQELQPIESYKVSLVIKKDQWSNSVGWVGHLSVVNSFDCHWKKKEKDEGWCRG